MTTQKTEVIERLHVGDRIEEAHEQLFPRHHLLVVVSDEQPSTSSFRAHPNVLHLQLADSAEEAWTWNQLADVLQLAALVARSVKDGRSAMVTCECGLNRSGLLAALALLKLGHPAPEAIDLVRRCRGPLALTNRRFVELLETMWEHRKR